MTEPRQPLKFKTMQYTLTPLVRDAVAALKAPNDHAHRVRLFRILVRIAAGPLLLVDGLTPEQVAEAAQRSIHELSDQLNRARLS